MKPVALHSTRLVLDQPGEADLEDITRYCRDPLFEQYLTTPWPYERRHAIGFLENVVAPGWAEDRDFTWALRRAEGGPLLGVISWRSQLGDIGFTGEAPMDVPARDGTRPPGWHGELTPISPRTPRPGWPL